MQKVGLASYRATAAIALTWLRVVMLVSGGWLSFDPLRRVTPPNRVILPLCKQGVLVTIVS